jgi:YesN/AraC family two-component response regulator
MIVDDEALVRIGLQSIIDWESRGYRITGVFKSGAEAIDAAARDTFDIVLTDIRMPGMDGFELIRKLKQSDDGLKFIILSSYSDFEYTRQAIQAGVTDYISKYEMEPDELLRVLDSLSYDERKSVEGPDDAAPYRSIDRGNVGADEKTALLQRTSEGNAISLPDDFPGLYGRLDAAGLTLRWICLRPVPRESGYSATEKKAMALQAEEIFSRMRRLEYIGEDSGLLHGLCMLGEDETEADGLVHLHQKAEELKAAWAKNLNIGLIAGISSNTALERIVEARTEAERAIRLSFYEGAGIYFNEQSVLNPIPEQEWLEGYKQAKTDIQYLHFKKLGDGIDGRLNDSRRRLYPGEWLRMGEMIATHLMDLLIERYDMDMESIRSRFGALWPLNEAFKKVTDRTEYSAVMKAMLTRTEEVISSMQPRRGWVLKVKEYVESRYGDSIRLEEAAEMVGFSPNHFSQRFRQETGEAFSDYVTRIRIREAIRLYKETNYSTEEIASRVGYLNSNYFIKVFKKTTGLTVKQFKQRG